MSFTTASTPVIAATPATTFTVAVQNRQKSSVTPRNRPPPSVPPDLDEEQRPLRTLHHQNHRRNQRPPRRIWFNIILDFMFYFQKYESCKLNGHFEMVDDTNPFLAENARPPFSSQEIVTGFVGSTKIITAYNQGAGFVLLQTVPVLYEKYEDQVDAFAEKAEAELKKHYVVFNVKVLSKIPKGSLKYKKFA
ncbi:hypothetical protein BUALT_BualtUnG0015900 [Buddleja alternifolia]|uniref:Reticulon domain-containing protein n=1 Tax=Buddleja alternifolia TaxID=168488 RepID=A0AAV6W1E6_9LAMI|nr:hypothetical protein BUALT_BualtUnG0015900 [Buddleja alternifolia]